MATFDTDTNAGASTDGRNLRAQRTAQQIAQAYLELLDQGDLRPAVRDIAGRAGVSERAVFRHFEDTESLFNAVAKMHLARVMADVPQVANAAGPFAERVDAYVKRWCWVFERTTPIRRASNLNEPFSLEIKKRHRWARGQRSLDFEKLFELELSLLTKKDRGDVVDAASATLDWHTWEHLRAHRALTIARATRIMTRTLTALFGETF